MTRRNTSTGLHRSPASIPFRSKPFGRSFAGAQPGASSRFRMPIQDQRDGRGRAFVHGEIHQKPLAIGRHGVLLLVRARQRAERDPNWEQDRWSSGFYELPIGC